MADISVHDFERVYGTNNFWVRFWFDPQFSLPTTPAGVVHTRFGNSLEFFAVFLHQPIQHRHISLHMMSDSDTPSYGLPSILKHNLHECTVWVIRHDALSPRKANKCPFNVFFYILLQAQKNGQKVDISDWTFQ